MHFDDESISPSSNACGSHIGHKVRVTGTVAWVDDNRKVCFSVKVWDGCEGECETGVRFEGPDTAFAEHHVRVSFVEDVF
ncbi:MAG: hypothetical protein RL240_3724, partial [Planctomycetota bacterium]